MRWVLRSKIHKARVTEANVDYVGSITIAGDLIRRVGLWVGERVLVASNTSGNRLETYVMWGEPGSGVICMNGAAAKRISKGEEIIILGFELSDRPVNPRIILLDEANRFVRDLPPTDWDAFSVAGLPAPSDLGDRLP
jgi:aspartate 1-decarboxylase